MIEVRNLTKKYGAVTAVQNLTFTVEPGKIYGFLGPNGAGKSTTMNMLTGCLAATEGEIRINGHDIYEDAVDAKRCIGYLPEIPPVYPDMTPTEYLRFVGEAKGLRGAELASQSEEAMKTVDVWPMRDRLIGNLSKGYRQRVGIAQALLGNPDIIILDEPTVGLDPRQILDIRRLIRSLGEKHTVILSSHILPEISAVCDHVMILSHGKLVANDSLENISSYLTGDSTTELTVKGDENAVKMALNDIEGVLSYEITDGEEAGVLDIVLQSDRHADIRDALFFAFAELRYPVYRLTTKTITLEDVFLRLTADETQSNMKNGLQWNEDFVETEEDEEDGEEADEEEETAETPQTYTSLFSRRDGGDRT